jgi:uncharacterized protein YgiM (DUF1202 family)
MKKTLFFILFSLIYVSAISQSVELEIPRGEVRTCFADGEVNFTTKKTNVYKKNDTLSEVLFVIPKTIDVILIFTNYQNGGWLKICHKGKNGWVRKENLTTEKPNGY